MLSKQHHEGFLKVFFTMVHLMAEFTKIFSKKIFQHLNFQTKIIWVNSVSIILIHLLAIIGFLKFDYITSWRTVLWGFFVGGLGGFGITAGAHRLWSHRSYKAKLPLRIFLMLCYSIAGQNNLYHWVRDHRVHHKFSETVADPHNVNRGFFFSHVGWLMMKKHPQVIEKGKKINMGDLFEDSVAAFLIRNFWWLKPTMCFIVPSVVPRLFWGETWFWSVYSQAICRYVANLNFTWLVNSIAHMWGNRPYDKNISPSENFVVSLLSIGEGWHNYHHTFPSDYRAAELGKFSITTFWLNFFAKIGWAYDLKVPSDSLVRRVAENRGDGTYTPNNHLAHPEIHHLDINGNIKLRRNT